MTIKDPVLFKKIKEFLTYYLSIVKHRSPETVESYKNAINLFLTYTQLKSKKVLTEITIKDFNQTNILGFIDWLDKDRKNVATTINQRLSLLQKFCEFLMKNDCLSISNLDEIYDISPKKDSRTLKLEWLTINETKLVLQQPNLKKKTGVRDRFFLALLYDSGCRIEEICNLHMKDFVVNTKGEGELHIIGKGTKYRCTPITEDVVNIYYQYKKLYHQNGLQSADSLLFYTVRNGISSRMSDDNARRFLNTYEVSARKTSPKLPHLHPHLLRHSRAMHLYMAGVPLPLIAEWLGHSRMETTWIYAQATIEMKRDAAKKLGENEKSVFKEDVSFKYADDVEVLKILSGLK